MKKIAVVLSGCGVKDGSEIYETVCTYLALDQAGVDFVSVAPNIEFAEINHLDETPTGEKRNVLKESARLARMNIKDIAHADVNEFDAVVIPGGFGAAMNLSDFGQKQADATVNADVDRFVGKFLEAGKPVGAMCIAPGTLAKIAQNHGKNITLTFGPRSQYKELAKAVESLGHTHQDCAVDDCVVDAENKVVTTPAFMLGPGIADIYKGIRKLVSELLALI
ncbi:MAG: isoprenoid biosynthesis glyoxalase ElbB [Planctomycetes bacterium]|nr:isoprenoid biosynthesis glyoxalase ElbB [Planctomycetota bacterium]